MLSMHRSQNLRGESSCFVLFVADFYLAKCVNLVGLFPYACVCFLTSAFLSQKRDVGPSRSCPSF